MPHLPHSHKCHASLHSHTHGVLCVAPPIHPLTHTGWLTAHTPSTHHHHWVCVCSSTCSHPPLTHTRDAQAWPMHGWLLVWSPPPRPLCPTITHTHTAGLVVWAMVVLGGARVPCVCLPRHHHTRLPSHHHHQRSCATTALTHTLTRDLVHAPLPHTRHMHHHTHQGVLCVDHTMPHPPPPTPSPHSLTHTPHGTHTHGINHTATMVLAIAHHAVHTHTHN